MTVALFCRTIPVELIKKTNKSLFQQPQQQQQQQLFFCKLYTYKKVE